MRGYIIISGIVFFVVAAVNACRLLIGWPVQVGSNVIPIQASWLPMIIGVVLAIWAVVSARHSKSNL